MSESLEVLRTCAAHGLPAVERSNSEDHRLNLTAELISLAGRHRVHGLLWSAVADGTVTGSDELVDLARQATVDALRTCLLSEQTAALALSALGGAGIEARALKGVVIAHLDHDNPAERVFGDADLLIRRADYDVALSALTDAGFRRSKPPVRTWWEQRFAKAVVLYAPSGGELDLHLRIAGGYFGETIDHDRLWATSSERFDLAGVEARGLDREGRLLHACCHTVLGGASGLRVRRDVAQLVLLGHADWQAMVARAELDGVDQVLAQAVRTTWADLRLDVGHGFARWANELAPDAKQQRAIATYNDESSGGWGSEGRGTLAALGPADRIRFLAGLAVPSQSSRRSRGRTWSQHLRSGAAVIRQRFVTVGNRGQRQGRVTGYDDQASTPPPPESCNAMTNLVAEVTIGAVKVCGPAAGLPPRLQPGDSCHRRKRTRWTARCTPLGRLQRCRY